MRILKFLFALLFCIGLTFICNLHQPFGSSIPALGKLFNPFSGFWQNAESSTPDFNPNQFDQLSAAVKVVFDKRLVPHIFAEDTKDALFVQGYITAKYRLWQMDIATRAVSGRLSEVMGEATIARDKWQRRKGLLWSAEKSLEVWKKAPQELALLQAYTDGVNAYIEQLSLADYPIEFKLLGYAPQKWTNLHAALFMKYMAETLCSRNTDMAASNARTLLGETTFNQLFPLYNPNNSPIIPIGTEWNFEPLSFEKEFSDSTLTEGMVPFSSFPQPSEFIGSNNWAVSGSKTASGYPILCNDPHLQLTLPSIWYEIQLHTPEYNVYGVSLPGLPGVVIGFNEDIAWGMTNVGQDVLDWYTIDWVDPNKQAYYLDGKEERIEERIEEIKVRNRRKSIIDTVKYTYWGPVVFESDDSEYKDMAMRWMVHDAPEERAIYELGMSYGLAKAKSFEEYSSLLQNYDSPPQNFVFASKTGDIALKINGRFPLKRQEQGRFIQDGNSKVNDWQGYIPKEHVPITLNPERGFVASANQRSTDTTYPYPYHGGFDDYRGRYINRKLASLNAIDVEDMKNLQNDNFSLKAEEGVSAMINLLDRSKLDPTEKKRLESLEKWDYRFESTSLDAVLFEEWFKAAYKQTFDEILPYRDSIEMLLPEEWRFIEMLQKEPSHTFFDIKKTPEKESSQQLLTETFQYACAQLSDKLEDDGFNWSTYKATKIRHLGRIPAFTVDNVDVGGYGLAPNAIKPGHGPSWRMIVAFGPDQKAFGVYPGGQSGNPGSRYYDNMIDSWAKGDYYELSFMKKMDEYPNEFLFSVDFEPIKK